MLMGFGTLALALVKKPPLQGAYLFFSGFIWLTTSVFIMPEYGAEWVILGVAFALFILFEGAHKLAGGEL